MVCSIYSRHPLVKRDKVLFIIAGVGIGIYLALEVFWIIEIFS